MIETYRQGFLRLDPHLLGSIWDREQMRMRWPAMESRSRGALDTRFRGV